MSARQFEVLEVLGTGSFCTAYKVRRISDKQCYAMKKAQLKNSSSEELGNALNEVRILASVHHPNVVAYKEAFVEEVFANTTYKFFDIDNEKL